MIIFVNDYNITQSIGRTQPKIVFVILQNGKYCIVCQTIFFTKSRKCLGCRIQQI